MWFGSWKEEKGCPLLVLHNVAPRTGGCHRRLVTGTVAVHMLLVVVIQPPCRRSDSPRVQQSTVRVFTKYINICKLLDVAGYHCINVIYKIYLVVTCWERADLLALVCGV